MSGDVLLTDVTCERLTIKSVSGDVEYTGTIASNGRYEINSHSGDRPPDARQPAGLRAEREQLQRLGAVGHPADNRRRFRRQPRLRAAQRDAHNIRATFGDGSATLSIRTFSGDIVIAKR